MADERTPRENDTRIEDQRPSDNWVPPSVLPCPNDRPGYVHRWVRTSSLGNSDNTNVSMRFREGWEPVKAEDYPELKVQSDHDSRFTGNVEIGGLLLCRCPEEKMRQRDEHYSQMASGQMETVDRNFMRENDPRMPLLDPERKTRNTFGRDR